MICLKDVKYTYPNGIVGLKGVSLKVEGNTLIGGYTGSGKSTLLRIFNGLIPNFYGGKLEGDVRIDTEVFFIGQNADEQIVASRVYDEIALHLLHRGYEWNEVDRRVKKVAKVCGIEELLNRRTFELSDGEKRLVTIASALASDCRCLALDEPFSNLHPRIADKILKILLRQDRIVVLSEHRIEFAEQFEEFFWMEDGRIVDIPELNDSVCGREFKSKETVVKVESITFGYDKPLFEGLSFDVKRGEIFAIIGENGCGKTTLLRLIAGTLKPWDGRIEVRGKIGMTFSFPNYHLFESRVDREVHPELLKLFDLEKLADRHPHSLSFGQAKRVAIAKAFCGDVVLLDEPTAGQDFKFRIKLLDVAKELGKTVIIATHDLKLAECCDDVLEIP